MRPLVHRQLSEMNLGLKAELEKQQTASTMAVGSTWAGSPGMVPDREMEIDLPDIDDLPSDLREQITDLLQSRSYTTQEELLEGWLQAEICGENQPRQSKYVILSSYCLYILDSRSLRLERKINIPQVQLVSLTPAKNACVLHVTHGGDVLIDTAMLPNLLTALQVIYNDVTRKYIPCVTIDSNELLRKRINAVSKSTLGSFHSQAAERVTSILTRKGELGETQVFLRKARYGSEMGFVLLSDEAIYFLSEEYTAKERLQLDALTSATLSSESLTLHAVKGDYVVYLGVAFLEAVDKALGRKRLARLTVRPDNSASNNQPLYSLVHYATRSAACKRPAQ